MRTGPALAPPVPQPSALPPPNFNPLLFTPMFLPRSRCPAFWVPAWSRDDLPMCPSLGPGAGMTARGRRLRRRRRRALDCEQRTSRRVSRRRRNAQRSCRNYARGCANRIKRRTAVISQPKAREPATPAHSPGHTGMRAALSTGLRVTAFAATAATAAAPRSKPPAAAARAFGPCSRRSGFRHPHPQRPRQTSASAGAATGAAAAVGAEAAAAVGVERRNMSSSAQNGWTVRPLPYTRKPHPMLGTSPPAALLGTSGQASPGLGGGGGEGTRVHWYTMSRHSSDADKKALAKGVDGAHIKGPVCGAHVGGIQDRGHQRGRAGDLHHTAAAQARVRQRAVSTAPGIRRHLVLIAHAYGSCGRQGLTP